MMPPQRAQVFWFMALLGAWFIALAMLQVMTPWLVAVVLKEPPERVGIAQMMLTLPMMFLIMSGGLLADRYDRRRLLILLHLLASLPAWAMVWLAWHDSLSYGMLLLALFGISIGGAFIRPACDAMLSEVAGDQIQRIVTMSTGFQFGLQIIGYGLAGNAEQIALPLLLGLLALALMSGSFTAAQLNPAPIASTQTTEAVDSGGFWSGLRYVWQDSFLFPIILLNLAVGIFYSGVYGVVLPLVIIQVYGGSAPEISLGYTLMMLGTITTVMILLKLGGVHRRQGRALMLALFSGVVILVLMSQLNWFSGFMGMVYIWGCGAGVAMSLSRTMVQENAPAHYRARILSIFSLGMMGGAPIGAFLMGYSVAFFGPLNTLLLAACGMGLFIMLVFAGSSLWRTV